LFLLALGLFFATGLVRSDNGSVSVELSCGVWVTTVDWTYFGNLNDWGKYLIWTDNYYCGEEEEAVD
jgi:hypothetical protein